MMKAIGIHPEKTQIHGQTLLLLLRTEIRMITTWWLEYHQKHEAKIELGTILEWKL